MGFLGEVVKIVREWKAMLLGAKSIPHPPPVPPPNMRQRDPASHACPHCRAGLSRLYLVRGGVINNIHGGRAVAMVVGCMTCGATHIVDGDTQYELWLGLVIPKHPAGRGAWGKHPKRGLVARGRRIIIPLSMN